MPEPADEFEDATVDFIPKLNEMIVAQTIIVEGTQFPYKLVLSGDVDNIHANFEPRVQILHPVGDLMGEMPGVGQGPSTNKGFGVFESKHSVQGLFGTYKLLVGVATARLIYRDEQVWFGTGTQQGLDGVYEIVFPSWSK